VCDHDQHGYDEIAHGGGVVTTECRRCRKTISVMCNCGSKMLDVKVGDGTHVYFRCVNCGVLAFMPPETRTYLQENPYDGED